MAMKTYSTLIKDGKVYAEVPLRDVVERSDVSDMPILSEIKRLYEENDELRKLATDMFNCIRYANEQDWFYFERDKCGCGVSCVVNGEECGLMVLADRMKRLGIEVDNDD